jgi:hypothetical protein
MKKRPTRLLIMVLLALSLAQVPAMVYAAEDFQPIIGRWQRTDAGYVIEIRSIAPDGKITAGYFNPRPINVEQAQVEMLDAGLSDVSLVLNHLGLGARDLLGEHAAGTLSSAGSSEDVSGKGESQ